MLQSYCIQGFKSIKNATEVDLKKTQYQTLEKTNVCNGILKGCMFVGANASGKTNLREPDLLMVITGGELAYTRPDGVKIIPIGCLRD